MFQQIKRQKEMRKVLKESLEQKARSLMPLAF
jgi:hypothetical protein